MARNEEKAGTLFSKWSSFRSQYHKNAKNVHPLMASDSYNDIDSIHKYRKELIQNITKKLSLIQNATLGEHRIRELNDEINKLMKQKYYQERRIVELGGIDYRNAPKQYYDIEGKELPGMRGYKYYGVSRDLPGIRELFQAEKDASIGSGKKIRKSSMTTSELYKVITSDYYGYRDDDDGVLAKKEGAKELSLIKRSIKEYHNKISSGNSCSIASASVNGDDEYKIMSNILNTLSTITSSGSSSSSNSNDTTNSNSNDTTNSIGNVNSGNNDNSNNNDELADIIMNQKKRSLLEQYL